MSRGDRRRAAGTGGKDAPRSLSPLAAHSLVASFFFLLLLVLHWRVLLAWGGAQRWLWEDFVEYSFPIRSLAASQVARGSLPLWDPFTFAGMPLLADVGAGLLYPPNLLLAFFVRHGLLSFRALEWQVVLHIWLAGFGTYLLARRLTGSRAGGILAGITFMLSGFLSTHVIHLSVIQAASWLPFVFWTAWEAQAKRSVRWALGTGILLALSLLAGHPQTTLFLGMTASLVAVFRFLVPPGSSPSGVLPSPERIGWGPARFLPFLLLIWSALFAAALAAPQLLPTRELLGLTVRQELSYESASECSFGARSFLTLVLPRFFGSAHRGEWGSYWGPGRYYYFWELAAYVGLAPLLLSFLAVARKRGPRPSPEILFLAALALFGLLLAMGKYGFLHPLFYRIVPLYGRFRIPGRALVLFDFAVALLAAHGLARLMADERDQGRLRRGIWLVVLAGLMVVGLVAGGLLLAFRGPGEDSIVDAAAGRQEARLALRQLGLVGLLLAAALLAFGRRRFRPGVGAGALCGVVVLDLMLAGWGYSAGRLSARQFYLSGREEVVRLLVQDGETELFRVNSRPIDRPDHLVLRRNQGPILGIYTIEGYNQLKLAAYQGFEIPVDVKMNLLNVKYRSQVRPGDGALTLALNPGYLPRAFFVPRGRWVPTEAEVLTLMNEPEFDPAGEVLLLGQGGEGEPGSGAVATGGTTIKVTRHEPNRIELVAQVPQAGYVLLSEIYYPAWRARVDGREAPLLRADYCLRAVPVTAGSHTIEVFISAGALHRGLLAMTVALVAALVISRWSGWRGAKRAAPPVGRAP